MRNHWSQEEYIKAYWFAARAHGAQLLPGSDLPYLMHLSFVSMEIIAALDVEPGRNEDLAVQCALLHDVIEDTEATYDQVKAQFGKAVADGVLALTKAEGKGENPAKALRMADSLRRIRQQPHEVWMVKMADRITNLQPPPHSWTREKIADYGRRPFRSMKPSGMQVRRWPSGC